jgi:hypothetical protein
MDSIFGYISSIYSVRDKKSVPFYSPAGAVFDTLDNVHKSVLKHSYDKGDASAMIFENEMSLTRNLEDVNNNEIKTFLITNTDWDILILGQNNLPNVELVEGFTRIYKLNDSSYNTRYIYIASRRFMQKIKNGDISSISTYVYKPTFITNFAIDVNANVYQVGLITDIMYANVLDVKYKWSPLKV